MFGFFNIRKLFDISCISDHVLPISKPLSVVLAECGHFVVRIDKLAKAILVIPHGSNADMPNVYSATLVSTKRSTETD